jgi:hypothetical protein
VTRAPLILVLWAIGGAASARPAPAPAPVAPVSRDERASAAPPPDGTGARSRPTAADKRRTVALLEVRVEGLPDEVKDEVRRQLDESIDTKRFWLADRHYMKDRMMRSTKWTEGCIVGRCLTEIHTNSGAELVLIAALSGSGTSFGSVVTLIRTDTGHVVDQETDRCDVCTVNEAVSGATLAAVKLLNNLPDKLPDVAAEQSATMESEIGKARAELAEHDRHTAKIGTVLTAVGIAVAATGLALYFTQDQPTYAAATAVGGGALTASGLIVLRF